MSSSASARGKARDVRLPPRPRRAGPDPGRRRRLRPLPAPPAQGGRRVRLAGPARVGRAAPSRLAPPRADGGVRARARRADRRGGQAAEDGGRAGPARGDHARDRRVRLDGGDRRQAVAPRRGAARGEELRQRRAARCQRRRHGVQRPPARAAEPDAGARRHRDRAQPPHAERRHRHGRRDLLGPARAPPADRDQQEAAAERHRAALRRRVDEGQEPDRGRAGGQAGEDPRLHRRARHARRHDRGRAPRRAGRHRGAPRAPGSGQSRADRTRVGRPELHGRQRLRPQARLPEARLPARDREAQAPAHVQLRRRRARGAARRRRDVARVVREGRVSSFSGNEGSRMNEVDEVAGGAGGTRAQQQARFDEARDALEAALHEIKRVIVGQDAMLERLLVALLAGGHVLLEGVPGLAKTLTVKTLAQVLGGTFRRIQFTPDLVPADLVGTRIYRPDSGRFDTELGPVLTNFLLADEINRAPAKVQSALLEVMQENQVTIGGETFDVPQPFLVLATQNPIESEGTYPLPEAQTDRFLMKILVDYPTPGEEAAVVGRSLEPASQVEERLTAAALLAARDDAAQVFVDRNAIGYAVDLADATRRPGEFGLGELEDLIEFGASPRGPIGLIQCARALAMLRGRRHVILSDIRDLARDVLRHRLVLTYEALSDGVGADQLLDRVIEAVGPAAFEREAGFDPPTEARGNAA